MLHAYCLRRTGDAQPSPGMKGVAGRPIRVLTSGPLEMWVSDVGSEPVDMEQLREHDRVVQRALRSATPLPFRFGTRFVSTAEAERAMEGRATEFVGLLERLADHVEMGIRLLQTGSSTEGASAGVPRIPRAADDPETAPTPPSAGRAYLESRRRSLEERATWQAGLEERLGALEQAFSGDFPTVRTVIGKGEVIGTLAHLVHRRDLHRYRERVAELCRSRPDFRVELTGPWAPYSFVRNE